MVERYAPEYRAIELWNRKLENMLTILQAEDDSSKFLALKLLRSSLQRDLKFSQICAVRH